MKLIRAMIQTAFRFYTANDEESKRELRQELAKRMSEIDINKLQFKKEQENEYYSLFIHPKFVFCYFYFRKDHTMPLHDHPQMTVFFKVLKGTILLSQYKIIDETLKAIKYSKVVKGPSEMFMLGDEYTMHQFRILSDECVILDIIGPPYDESEHICTYYKDQSEHKVRTEDPRTGDVLYWKLPNGSAVPLDIRELVQLETTEDEYTCVTHAFDYNFEIK